MNLSILDQLVSFLAIGGPVVWIHFLMSIMLAAILLLKLWQFTASGLFSSSLRKIADTAVGQWQSGAQPEAIEGVRNCKDAQNQLLFRAMDYLTKGTLKGKALVDELTREATAGLTHLRSHLRTLELIASLAPLLGLLGTVLGMIEAFQAMELAGKQVDPSVLSGGIWKALFTTAVGLVVAVPAIVIHTWLDRRVDNYSDGLNDRVAKIITVSNMAHLQKVQPHAVEVARVSA